MTPRTRAHIARTPALYFAYGSNLDPAQMADRCPTAALVGPARWVGRRIAFGGYSVRWDGAVATFVEEAGALLDGLLYRVSEADIASLDYHEGHPFVYERVACTVQIDRGRRRRAFTYKMPLHSRGVAPSPEYLGLIAEAYGAHGFDITPLIGATKASLR